MLLDTQAMKGNLIAMMTVKTPGHDSGGPPATFVKFVNKEMSKAEAILKVVLSHVDPPEALVENYLFLFGNTDLNNFQRLLDLKGLKRAEMQPIVEVFKTHLPSTPSGEPSVTTTLKDTLDPLKNLTSQTQNAFREGVRKTMNINNVVSNIKIKPINITAPNPFDMQGGNPFGGGAFTLPDAFRRNRGGGGEGDKASTPAKPSDDKK